MTVYAANINGDWWSLTSLDATEILVIDTEDDEIKKLMEQYDVEEGEDGWDNFILAEGTTVNFYSQVKNMLKE